MKILVTGASSLPGYRAALELAKRGHEVVASYFTHDIPVGEGVAAKVRVDVRNYDGLSRVFKQYRPKAVVHMAAYGDVDGCEKDPALAWDVNVKGTANVVRLASKRSKYLLYLSTDYVFDGLKGGYGELDPPKPANYYGLTKLCGEAAALSSSLDRSIVRASSIYGMGPGRKNFAKFLVEKLRKNEPIKALVDQYTSPTQATLLARAVSEIIERGLTGVFHIVGERMSRYEFAVKAAKALGLDPSLVYQAKLGEMGWVARRPKDSSLNSEMTRKILNTDFYSMDEAFKLLAQEYHRGFQEGK